MKALLLVTLLVLSGCTTVSYHTPGDRAACQAEEDAWTDARGYARNSNATIYVSCMESKPMVTETRLGGYGNAVNAGGQHGTAYFYSPGGNSGTLFY